MKSHTRAPCSFACIYVAGLVCSLFQWGVWSGKGAGAGAGAGVGDWRGRGPLSFSFFSVHRSSDTECIGVHTRAVPSALVWFDRPLLDWLFSSGGRRSLFLSSRDGIVLKRGTKDDDDPAEPPGRARRVSHSETQLTSIDTDTHGPPPKPSTASSLASSFR